ncbi:hypothetical protein LX36DRAFT_75413 [Colletotrichum falcatum]|nr:hypothetical protein LX36DRAFT_75413 [Colletotrichum falcatum]
MQGNPSPRTRELRRSNPLAPGQGLTAGQAEHLDEAGHCSRSALPQRHGCQRICCLPGNYSSTPRRILIQLTLPAWLLAAFYRVSLRRPSCPAFDDCQRVVYPQGVRLYDQGGGAFCFTELGTGGMPGGSTLCCLMRWLGCCPGCFFSFLVSAEKRFH